MFKEWIFINMLIYREREQEIYTLTSHTAQPTVEKGYCDGHGHLVNAKLPVIGENIVKQDK